MIRSKEARYCRRRSSSASAIIKMELLMELSLLWIYLGNLIQPISQEGRWSSPKIYSGNVIWPARECQECIWWKGQRRGKRRSSNMWPLWIIFSSLPKWCGPKAVLEFCFQEDSLDVLASNWSCCMELRDKNVVYVSKDWCSSGWQVRWPLSGGWSLPVAGAGAASQCPPPFPHRV